MRELDGSDPIDAAIAMVHLGYWFPIWSLSTSCSLPSGDIVLPLGDHFLAATRENTKRGACGFSFLCRKLEKKDKEQLDDREKLILK